eukprot:GFYU01048862.1.p2 GENE.GFYU01048862.1~~GFYU01048862.1.p2  ORF type:complete len:102 (+),score=4.21 GFYU01048862.1:312-617(+)
MVCVCHWLTMRTVVVVGQALTSKGYRSSLSFRFDQQNLKGKEGLSTPMGTSIKTRVRSANLMALRMVVRFTVPPLHLKMKQNRPPTDPSPGHSRGCCCSTI